MSDDIGMGRRRVLELSGGILGGGLLSTVAGGQRGDGTGGQDPPIPGVADVTFYDLDTSGLELGPVPVPEGETVWPVASIGSGAYEATGSGGATFYCVSDAGLEIDCDDAAAVTGRSGTAFCGDVDGGSIRPVPDYPPTIYEMELREDGTAGLVGSTSLTDADGETVTTLPNPLTAGTTPTVSLDGETIPADPNGLDVEGIVRTDSGRFWVCEEYAPSLVEVGPDGEVLARHVPATVQAELADATYPVEGTLPEVFARRERGIESIGLAPDESTLFFAHQSPLANPDEQAFANSRNVRLGTFDPDQPGVDEQYLYRLDRPETFQRDAAAGAVSRSDVKVSELSVIDEDRLLVLERISQTTKFYVVDLSEAAPIPDRYDDPATRPTLAQVDPGTDDALDPVPKELLFSTDAHDGFPRKLEAIARTAPDELLVVNDSDFELHGAETRVARVALTGPLGGESGGTGGSGDTDGEFVENGTVRAGIGPAPTLEPLGRYASGADFDEGGAEIPAYDPASHRIFVVNGDEATVDVLDTSDPASPTLADQLDVTTAFDGAAAATNVSVQDGVLVAAIEADDTQADGAVGFYDAATLAELAVVRVGPLPDAVTVAPDGQTVLTANEGEPTDDYSEDPRGSISVVDVSDGVENATVRTAGFEAYVGQEADLRDDGGRIFGPDASAAQDFEPEYVAVAPDSQTAYATLQENNAIAIVDVDAAEVTDVVPLGFKDFSEPGNELDAVADGDIDIRNWPIYGLYQPDVVETFAVDGETYLAVANEGDAREYDALFETGVLVEVDGTYGLDATEDDGDNIDVPIDESAFDADVLDALLGLEATTQNGDVDGDGELEELYVFGGRSFSVLDDQARPVHESGDDFEQIVAEAIPGYFNAGDGDNEMDDESPASGPEPEGLAIGEVADSPFGFVGFEEIGGVSVYDLSDPAEPQFVQYLNTRDFGVNPEDVEESQENDDPADDLPADAVDDLAPEGLVYVPRADSPIDDPLLIVGYEVSGTTTIYRVETSVVGVDSAAISQGTTGTVDLSLLSALEGFAGGRLTVSVSHPEVAEIVDVTYPEELGLTAAPEISDDGRSVTLRVADVEDAVQPGATDVPLATIELEGTATGTADLTVDIGAFDDDAGDSIDVVTRHGVVVTGPPALPGGEGRPTDFDGDGRYEDVNGNGRLDYHDVVLLFEELESDAVRLNRKAYDFNDNGQLDYDDVVALYEQR